MPSGNTQSPSVVLITESRIQTSFEKTGISNALDGSKNHLRWDNGSNDNEDDPDCMMKLWMRVFTSKQNTVK